MKAYAKPQISVSKQLDHLESRGCVIGDRPAALHHLERIGYYRLKAYFHPFRIDKTQGPLRPGTTFENALSCYEFDRDLRMAIFQALEMIEIGIRTLLVERIARSYGAFAHLDPKAFPPRTKRRKPKGQKSMRELVFVHSSFVDKIRESISDSSEEFISHYRQKYTGFPDVPCWMAMELASFGTLAKIFYGAEGQARKDVSATVGINSQVLESWLHTLSYVRNLCAHHQRLWNRKLAVIPDRPDKKHEPLWHTPPIEDRVFIVLLIIRRILRGLKMGDGWVASLVKHYDEPFSNSWMARRMGFPVKLDATGRPELDAAGQQILVDWKKHPLWV